MAFLIGFIVSLSFWLPVLALFCCAIYLCRKPAEAPAPDQNVAATATGRRREPWRLGYFRHSAAAGGGASGAAEKVCAICLGELAAGEKCSEVPACRHVFHRRCIALWLEKKSTCPLCRETIAPAAAGDIV
ncbi:E3 ubiquitin-protein ligase Os06g0535400-like [Aegilops tauschii subsp. strangulata]|uniref:E3 ubiquitin-protein ligase Os06g0535400-like n=1 Tax=Aegilops tauschii subsp. strangulata TaxID=200361 RepID=UPI00098B808C|nr:E3 ubiquitin-protein ligase Os06g0535400-like [Aegilops tauschii subsp. strangulata]XP_044447276.1 E3 ubiquitin-protein ligase Os06g0535400-like [Triticum aestivum]